MEPMRPGETVSEYANRIVTAELEQAEQEDREAVEQLSRVCTGASVPYAIRLGPDELRVLHRRARAAGMKPTVLARALIRGGLSTRAETPGRRAEIAEIVSRLETGLTELRTLLA